MSPLLSTIFVLVASITAFAILIVWLRAVARDVASASTLLDSHYEAAQILTRDPRTPESVLRFTVFFAAQAGRPALARRVALDMARGRVGADTEPQTERGRDLMRDLHELPKPLADAFAKMVTCGMLASAASDPIFSRIFANVLRLVLSSPDKVGNGPSVERANTVALDIARAHNAAVA
jgi:hypothetical protein